MASILNTLGQIIGKTIKWIALAICGLVIIVTITPLAMRMIGYRVNANSSEVAALAVQKKDVSLCKSIISIGLFYPQSGELRSHCVFTYAKLAEDPTACRKIMPSGYGLSCINQSFHSVFTNNPDDENVDINADCSIYSPNPIRKDYCFFSKAHISKDLNLCKKIINSVIQTACNEKIGAWYQYPELRTSIYFGKYREGN